MNLVERFTTVMLFFAGGLFLPATLASGFAGNWALLGFFGLACVGFTASAIVYMALAIQRHIMEDE